MGCQQGTANICQENRARSPGLRGLQSTSTAGARGPSVAWLLFEGNLLEASVTSSELWSKWLSPVVEQHFQKHGPKKRKGILKEVVLLF